MKSLTPSRWILLTGLSGAGKNTALKILEDQGYAAIDNLPVDLLPGLIELLKKSQKTLTKLVLGLDIRARDFLKHPSQALEAFHQENIFPQLIFLDCSDQVLIQRFSESRRPHPLSIKGQTLQRAIHKERELLQEIKFHAHKIFDTSQLHIHELKRQIHQYLSKNERTAPLNIHLLSFGFREGVPPEADMVFDVRFLKNPHFEPQLRSRSGTNASVKKFVFEQKDAQLFLKKILDLLIFLIPRFLQEGKSHLTLAFGCTGGKHRSVAMVETLAEKLSQKGWDLARIHRDLND